MSLILGVTKGDKLYINESVLSIIETAEDKRHIHIKLEDKDFLLNDREFIEIAPTVFACVGKAKHATTLHGHAMLPRLAIDAPRSINIQRERLKT